MIPRNPNFALAGLEIESLVLGGKMGDDGSMDFKVFLVGFILDDARMGNIGIKRLMDKKMKSGNLIDISYTKDGKTEDQSGKLNFF